MFGASLSSDIANNWFSITPKGASGALEISNIKQLGGQGLNLSQKLITFEFEKLFVQNCARQKEREQNMQKTSHETIYQNTF